MDFAEQLATLRAQPPEQLVKSANRYLPPAAALALVVVIAYLAAQLTWRLVPTPTAAAPLPALTTPGTDGTPSGGTFEARRVVDRHLFGVAPPPDERAEARRVADAPETTLPLKLVGVALFSATGEESIANVSVNNGEARPYRVNQAIEGVRDTSVLEIFEREIRLNEGGVERKLSFCPPTNQDRAECRTQTVAARPVAPRTQAPVVQTRERGAGGAEVQQLIAANAQRVAEILRPAIAQDENGNMIGIRVSANRDRATFEALGFKDNDVIMEINGTRFSNVRDGLAAIESLAEAGSASVLVQRDGNLETLTLDTTRLRSILENRQ